MWLRTSCKLNFTVGAPTPFILMLRPRSGAQQWVARETYTLTPSVPVVEFTDAYGNLCQRLIAPPGEFSIRTSADVMTADTIDVAPGAPFDEVQNLPDAVLTYLLPSRYCESELFFDMASGMVAGVAPGYDQVACITDWIRREVRFNSASIYDHMSAIDVNQRREGVCRDLAHLGIALCRAPVHSGAHGGGLPARAGADGPACVVRSLRGRALVHLRRDAGCAARRPRHRRVRPRRRQCGDLQPVRAGVGADRHAGDGRTAGAAPA